MEPETVSEHCIDLTSGAVVEAQRLLEEALNALRGFGESADMLRDLARYIVERDR